jgi:hypothetical protein
LFQAQGDPGLGISLAQLEQPLPKGFGGRCQSGRIDVGRWWC